MISSRSKGPGSCNGNGIAKGRPDPSSAGMESLFEVVALKETLENPGDLRGNGCVDQGQHRIT